MDKDLEALLGLFDERETVNKECTGFILNTIHPTVIEALLLLFGITYEHLDIVEVAVNDSVLVLACLVKYDPASSTSEFINRLAPITVPEGVSLVERVMKIGIPLDKVFQSPATICTYLDDLAKKNIPAKVEEKLVRPADQNFDSKVLTREQVDSLLFFQQQTKDIKQ